MIRRAMVLGVVAIVTSIVVSAPVTLATFTASKTSTAALTTGSLQPPTAVAGSGGATVATLTWTASTSGAATGYQLLRSATSGSGYTQVKSVTPVSATTTTDTPGSGTWFYVLQTYLSSWTSGNSNEASVVVGATSTGLKDCTQNAPETTGSGDNNGYETNPAFACGKDGQYATDASSGSTGNMSCSSTGQDRHKFWGYSLGLPGTVTSINGISVQLVAGLNAFTGTNNICVQVSWDSGTTWSAYEQVTLTSAALTTYQLGGPADTWGNAGWTLAQLGASTLRVRITDVSSVGSRAFHLDQVAVAVNYTP